jgi:hypothetical protein
MTLHSAPGCTMPQSAQSSSSGTVFSTVCTSSQSNNGGCAIGDGNPQSFGEGFNAGGGGVYAVQWTNAAISMWSFPRSSIPGDIASKNPNPLQWGTPVAHFPSTSCDIGNHFVDQSLVIDTTLCGDWAGAVYSSSGCPGTCAEAVANPANFKSETYWMDNNDAR